MEDITELVGYRHCVVQRINDTQTMLDECTAEQMLERPDAVQRLQELEVAANYLRRELLGVAALRRESSRLGGAHVSG